MTGPTVLGERETSILRWRCRRGLLENDIFIKRFFDTYGANVSEDQAFGLTLLMNLPDNDLCWICFCAVVNRPESWT